MHKAALIDNIAQKANVTKKQADAAFCAALEVIAEALASGDKVTILGFGTFEVRSRSSREGRNPKTGEKMTISASRVPVFSAGKLFKEKVALSNSQSEEAA